MSWQAFLDVDLASDTEPVPNSVFSEVDPRNDMHILGFMAIANQSQEFQCTYCTSRFCTNAHLIAHLQTHMAFRCSTCKTRFANEIDLFAHFRIKHNYKNSYKCRICSTYCHKLQDMRAHLRLHHTYTMCNICTKPISTKRGIRAHVLTYHKAPPAAVCPECGNFYMGMDMLDHQCDKLYAKLKNSTYRTSLK